MRKKIQDNLPVLLLGLAALVFLLGKTNFLGMAYLSCVHSDPSNIDDTAKYYTSLEAEYFVMTQPTYAAFKYPYNVSNITHISKYTIVTNGSAATVLNAMIARPKPIEEGCATTFEKIKQIYLADNTGNDTVTPLYDTNLLKYNGKIAYYFRDPSDAGLTYYGWCNEQNTVYFEALNSPVSFTDYVDRFTICNVENDNPVNETIPVDKAPEKGETTFIDTLWNGLNFGDGVGDSQKVTVLYFIGLVILLAIYYRYEHGPNKGLFRGKRR